MSKKYWEYLKSEHWKQTRFLKLEDVGYRCEKCLINRATQIHHLHYNSLYKEDIKKDLLAVCKKCHLILELEKIEENKNLVKKYEQLDLDDEIKRFLRLYPKLKNELGIKKANEIVLKNIFAWDVFSRVIFLEVFEWIYKPFKEIWGKSYEALEKRRIYLVEKAGIKNFANSLYYN